MRYCIHSINQLMNYYSSPKINVCFTNPRSCVARWKRLSCTTESCLRRSYDWKPERISIAEGSRRSPLRERPLTFWFWLWRLSSSWLLLSTTNYCRITALLPAELLRIQRKLPRPRVSRNSGSEGDPELHDSLGQCGNGRPRRHRPH